MYLEIMLRFRCRVSVSARMQMPYEQSSWSLHNTCGGRGGGRLQGDYKMGEMIAVETPSPPRANKSTT